MQPTAYPVRLPVLRKFWQTFMETGQVAEVKGAAPDPIVIQSWRRCAPLADPHVKPRPTILKEKALSSLMKAQSDLITVAVPYMEDVHQFIEGSGAAILLADGAACVLAVGGDDATRALVNDYRLGVGAFWSEGYLGTNALAITLVTAMPVQVVGAEHYFQVYHHLTSTAAPIHDVNGRIIGIIGVVNAASESTSHTLSLVMAVARAISNQLQANLYLEEANHRLTELNTILETINEGVIAWKANGRINHINTQAGKLLNLSPNSALGKPLTEVLNLPPALAGAISENQELNDTEITFELNKDRRQSIHALVSLRSMCTQDGRPVGYIAMLRPIEHVRRIVHQQVGTQATLTLDDVNAVSSVMRAVIRQVRIAARGTAPVLLRGEGGVGKNHLARAIHNASPRADKPFISINCRAMPRELVVSEFLGYEKDAGHDGRPSKFELADGGTLLLDRIESLSLEMQSALLQVVETGCVMRIGSTRPIPVDVRIIAATTADLETGVRNGAFISHLYYRFGVFNIYIPPLRQRAEDIPLLAERFLDRITRNHEETSWLTDEAVAVMCRYPWPGNVRELEMVLERAIHYRRGTKIHVIDLPEVVRNGRVMAENNSPKPEPVLSAAEAEREAIIRAGWACKGRVTEMARELGIGRTTLWRKMKWHKIDPDHFKGPQLDTPLLA